MPSLRYGFGTEIFKYFVFNDPAWDYPTLRLLELPQGTAQAASILNATDPNLDAFKARGGKLVLWHGWSDPALTALGDDEVLRAGAGARSERADYVRMFMMPGVLHCAGGPGPDRVDWAAVIDDWVEKGAAPERIVATKMASGKVDAHAPAVRVSAARGLQGHRQHRRRSRTSPASVPRQ